MLLIAFLSQNISMGCMFGSFGVLVPAVEAKLGINRDLSSLGLPCAVVALAIMSPIAGTLVSKVSIRLLMLVGALMSVAGFLVLAVAAAVPAYLAVYCLLLGPAQAFTAVVLPSTLVTRWYQVNPGRALGLISMPIVATLVPLGTSVALRDYGLSMTYCLLGIAMAVIIIPLLFVIDFPPYSPLAHEKRAGESNQRSGRSVGQLLSSGSFWMIAIAGGGLISTGTALAAHMVPMSRGWGIDATKAASLVSVASLAGMAGSISYGWLADRLGGARTLGILCLFSALLWAAVAMRPGYPLLVALVALLGLNGGGVIATLGMAMSQQFGALSFGRAFGLGYLVSLPFNIIAVVGAAHIFVRTGSYFEALVGMAGMLVLTGILAVLVRCPSVLRAAA